MTNLHGNMAGNGAGHTARRTPHRDYAAFPALPCCLNSRERRGVPPSPRQTGGMVPPAMLPSGRLLPGGGQSRLCPPFPRPRRVAELPKRTKALWPEEGK